MVRRRKGRPMPEQEPMWRVGRSQPINLYYGGEYVGVAFGSPAVAAAIVQRMNEDKPIPAGTGVDWPSVEDALNGIGIAVGGEIRGVIYLLSRKLSEALAELEAFMQQEHGEKCGRSGGLDDYGFGKCKHEVCTGYRKRLNELRGHGE